MTAKLMWSHVLIPILLVYPFGARCFGSYILLPELWLTSPDGARAVRVDNPEGVVEFYRRRGDRTPLRQVKLSAPIGVSSKALISPDGRPSPSTPAS